MLRPPPTSTLFPYTTLFRSVIAMVHLEALPGTPAGRRSVREIETMALREANIRSEEHTSELQSHHDLVCRLLLEKKKKKKYNKLQDKKERKNRLKLIRTIND